MSDTEPDLKPCPFCGGPARHSDVTLGGGLSMIQCYGCYANVRGEEFTGPTKWAKAKASAAEAWNMRGGTVDGEATDRPYLVEAAAYLRRSLSSPHESDRVDCIHRARWALDRDAAEQTERGIF